MNVLQELTECLALQQEIDAKKMELRRRYKEILETERAKGNNATICAEIDGEMYALEREDFHKGDSKFSEATAVARELGGFYLYRLYKVGKLIT